MNSIKIINALDVRKISDLMHDSEFNGDNLRYDPTKKLSDRNKFFR